MSLFSNIRLFYIIGIAVMVLGLIPALLLTRSGSSSAPQDVPSVPVQAPEFSTSPEATETATVQASPTGTPIKQYSAPPPVSIDTTKHYFADIKTDKGDIRLELFADKAPQTVNNFIFLAKDGFFGGVPFHRVIPGFVAQTGDPTATGQGGPGYTLPLENSGLTHDAGTIAMAASGGQALSGSQFYITFASLSYQDGRDTVFGRVVSGMEVLQQLTPRCDTPNQVAGCQQGQVDTSSLSRILAINIEERS